MHIIMAVSHSLVYTHRQLLGNLDDGKNFYNTVFNIIMGLTNHEQFVEVT